MKTEKFTINYKATVIEALKKLNEQENAQTLFVIDSEEIVIGTLTDGDIRRGIISGLKLDDSIEKYIFREFSSIIEDEKNFDKLKKFREERLQAVPVLDNKGRLIKVYDFSVIKSILPVDAVIMAGGKGERLFPLTIDTPKPLLKVSTKEIISYNFDRLSQFGIENQFVTVNYLGEKVEKYCNDYNSEINFKIIKEESFLGTAGALSLISHFDNETILLMNSDILTNLDYEDFYRMFVERDADIMVASIPYSINLPYAILESENGNVKSFKEKPNYKYYANAGIYLIKKDLLKIIPKNILYNATDFMDDVIKNGGKLIHYPIRGYWLDIGKHEDYEQAQKDISHIDFD
jgi:dTDP-glucose pyrophosphorylase/CBS domain-containing protein